MLVVCCDDDDNDDADDYDYNDDDEDDIEVMVWRMMAGNLFNTRLAGISHLLSTWKGAILFER